MRHILWTPLDISGEAQGAALSSRQIGEALVVRQGLEATIVVTRTTGGTIAVKYFRLQERVDSVTGLAALGGWIFGGGLPGWAIVRWVVNLIEKNRDAGMDEVAKEAKGVFVVDQSLPPGRAPPAVHPTVPAANNWRHFGLRPALFLAALPFNRNGNAGRPLTSLFQADSKVAIAFWAS